MTLQSKNHPVGMSGKAVVLAGLALIGLIIIPLLLAGRGVERYVDLRSLKQIETSSWRIGSLHLTGFERVDIDEWPIDEAHPHILRAGLGSPLRPAPSLYWQELTEASSTDSHPPLWRSSYRLMPMLIFIPIENRRALSADARSQLDLRLVMVSVLDPAKEEDREAFWRLDDAASRGARVIDPMNPPRGRVTYQPPSEGEAFARRVLDRVIEGAHQEPDGIREQARAVLLSYPVAGKDL
jgi:hypothetical protein